MTAPTRRSALRLLAAPALASLVPALRAEGYPAKPIRIVVPFPPGGATDAGTRLIGEKMAQQLKQPVIVDNKAGAGTTIGAAFAAAAPPDGYTLYVTGPITHASSAALYKNLSYDAVKSFTPVGQMVTGPFVIVVHASSKATTLMQLIEMARAAPGKLSYASTGNGAAPHLASEMIARATGTRFAHIPYRGTGPALMAVLRPEVDFLVSDVAALPQIREGKLRALALTTARRSALVPGVPSLEEAGVTGVDVVSGLGMLAPAGTPREVIAQINAALNKALADDEVKAKLAVQGLETSPSTPDAFGRFLAGEVATYVRVVKDAGITVD